MSSLSALMIFLAPAKRPVNYLAALRHLGTLGLFALAMLDSSPLPTFGGPDILTAILAARHRDPWYWYAAVSTVGSVIGAVLTFRMARRAGSSYLQQKFGERRVAKLLAFFHKWGTGALAVSAAVPVPSPTSAFFAAAGVLNYPARKFVIVVALARAARYSAIAYIASLYGRHFVRALRHPDRYIGVSVVIVGAVLLLVLVGIMVRRQLDDAKELSANGGPVPTPVSNEEV